MQSWRKPEVVLLTNASFRAKVESPFCSSPDLTLKTAPAHGPQICCETSTLQSSCTVALCSIGKLTWDPSSNRTSVDSFFESAGWKLALTRRTLFCWGVDSGSLTCAMRVSSVYEPSMKTPGSVVGTSLYTMM